jgi:hypothetical protein
MPKDQTNEYNDKAAVSKILSILNESPPIINSQFEIWYSGWPRLKWLAQSITVPGLTSKTLPVNFSGFQVPVVINTTYEGDMSLTMDILADEFGQYYKFWRDGTIYYSSDRQKGRPILDGMFNETYNVMQGASYLIVKLVNSPTSVSQHCWRFHNFKITGVGEMQFGQTAAELTTFPVSGIYTHVSYTWDRSAEPILGAAATGNVDNGGGGTQPPMTL